MRIRNLRNKINKIKKSQILLLGSLFVFLGVTVLSWNYLQRLKNEVYSDMRIAMSEVNDPTVEESSIQTPIANNLPTDQGGIQQEPIVNYDKYLGVLEIPKIGLKRGFYNIDSKYNNIQYNVSMVKGSTLPDVVNGNLILMAHSGDAYISYFAFLYRLNIGDYAYVTYQGSMYKYRIVNIYDVPKNGVVKIIRNYDRTTLTLVTCTKNNDTLQTVYIAELI